MSFPYLNPHSLTYGGTIANFGANLELTPIFVAPRALTITGFSVVTNKAVTPVEALTNINAYLINMAAPTAQLAYINVNSTTAMTANAVLEANIIVENVASGTVLGIYMNASNVANGTTGYWGEAGSYQMDYVFGSPASEG